MIGSQQAVADEVSFVHQNMPGQYREMVHWFAASGQHEIYFVTQRKNSPEFTRVETRV